MKTFFNEYGMVLVLAVLCAFFSLMTLKKVSTSGPEAVAAVVAEVEQRAGKDDRVLAIGAYRKPSVEFAQEVYKDLQQKGYNDAGFLAGNPQVLRKNWDDAPRKPTVLILSGDVLKWTVVDSLREESPGLHVVVPKEGWQSDFLKKGNLLAIVDRIVVIAVIAIGMTLVILTGGIDLSVGSLIALSAVVATLVMKVLGGLEASGWVVWLGFLAGTAMCGLIGAFSGTLVAWFRVAPFIATLAIMLMARGFAFIFTGGFSIYQVPDGLVWLGQGKTLRIPNTVALLVILYGFAHWFMKHTRYGRYIYAVGGNEEAARLSGVPVKVILIFVYLIAGLTAGFGGCIQASQLNSGAPNLGMMFELYVIAAVVVGGTSLSGGSGRIMGTLIGAFIISVIQNGMNLLGFNSYLQQVVLGGVILAAVLLDKVRERGGVRKLLHS